MNKSDIEFGMTIFVIIGISWLLVAAINKNLDKWHNLQKEAISLGHAEYNSTNGNWQWKTNTIK